ncbi:hypothetical protein HDU84_002141 [Entophlyctis sp. JEL0112]|nr:hypothetical protein HDU84_002141 [Entophlyctis sp. JEL0112]
MISEYPRDSLHYALALLLTHCENINHVNLQLPLPVPLSDFPLKLCLMPGLRCLEITTRVTDSMLRAIFSGAQEHGLRELRLTRPSAGQELTGAVVAESLQRLHPGRVERLVLPSVIQRSVGAASCGMPTRMPRTWLYAIPAAVVSHTVTMMHVMPVVERFSRLLELDISVLGASIPKGCTFDALEAVSKLSQLRRLTLSLSKSGGIGVPEICTQILPCLRELRALTLKASLIVSASMSGYDYVGDGTVEEEELMLVPRYWCGPLNVPAAITLVGLDMVRGSAEGVMRAYYSCAGGDAGMLGDFRQRWELLFAPNFALAFRNE